MIQLESPVNTPAATIGFIDLAGFSAITEVYGDASAVSVLDRFEALVEASLGQSGRLVKWIGDAAMLAFPDPQSALCAMGALIPACRATREIPLTRVALHHGPVLERRGDYFGATVNAASRISGLAAPGQVLATQCVADAASAGGISVEALGPISLRSMSQRLPLYSIALADGVDSQWIDPVCKMLAPYSAFVRQRPEKPWFCSPRCEEAFESSPETYLPGAAAAMTHEPETEGASERRK